MLWNTDIVTNESILMIEGEDARLLYEPVQVITVQNLAKGEIYEEGRDYIVRGRRICRTPDSRIYAFKKEELYPEKGEPGRSFKKPEGYILFSEGAFFIERQIAVTYTCKKGQWQGVVPEYAGEQLPNTIEKLKQGQDCHILLYGDSISAGANNTKDLDIPPYQPEYGVLLHQALCQHYGEHIRYTNTSVGGKETHWAIEEVEERVNAYSPDLVIIAFGMNDGGKMPYDFAGNIRTLIRRIRAKKAETEFILVATSLPNALLTDPEAPFWGHQSEYLPVLEEIAIQTKGVAVANITDVHRELMRYKRFTDLTSNNVNHPNDFFYRWHAEYITAMLCDEF